MLVCAGAFALPYRVSLSRTIHVSPALDSGKHSRLIQPGDLTPSSKTIGRSSFVDETLRRLCPGPQTATRERKHLAAILVVFAIERQTSRQQLVTLRLTRLAAVI